MGIQVSGMIPEKFRQRYQGRIIFLQLPVCQVVLFLAQTHTTTLFFLKLLPLDISQMMGQMEGIRRIGGGGGKNTEKFKWRKQVLMNAEKIKQAFPKVTTKWHFIFFSLLIKQNTTTWQEIWKIKILTCRLRSPRWRQSMGQRETLPQHQTCLTSRSWPIHTLMHRYTVEFTQLAQWTADELALPGAYSAKLLLYDIRIHYSNQAF